MGKHEDRLLIEALRADDEVLAGQYMVRESKNVNRILETVKHLAHDDFKKLFIFLCHALIETECHTTASVYATWLKAALESCQKELGTLLITDCGDALMALQTYVRLRHADRRFLSILSETLKDLSESLIRDIQVDALNQARGTKVQNAMNDEPLCIYVVEPHMDED